MQGKQTRAIYPKDDSRNSIRNFKAIDPCYGLYFGPKQTKDPRLVPAELVKRTGTCTIQVQTVPQGSIWRHHIDQLRPEYPSTEDDEPSEDYSFDPDNTPKSEQIDNAPEPSTQDEQESSIQVFTNTSPHSLVYGPSNPRRSTRAPKQRTFNGCALECFIISPFLKLKMLGVSLDRI